MKIGGLQRLSLIDYPDKVSAVVFLAGCNFRCSFCYNKDLVEGKNLQKIKEEDFFKFLEGRKGLIDGVCITGGEPTLDKELIEFISKIKKRGFLVKLDTNGNNPEVLKELVDKIDFIAMDVKASFNKYEEIVNAKVEIEKLKKSIEIISNSGIDYEFRMTVVPELHSEEDIISVARMLKGKKKLVLQNFKSDVPLMDKKLEGSRSFSEEELNEIKKKCSVFTKTEIRNT